MARKRKTTKKRWFRWLPWYLVFVISFNISHAIVPTIGGPNPDTLITDTREDETSVAYIIAGNSDQPSRVIQGKILEYLKGNFNKIIFLNYSWHGYDPNKFIQYAVDDIAALPEDTKITIYGISQGAQPAIAICNLTGAKLVLINPSTGLKSLQSGWKIGCIAGDIVFSAAGWFGYLPIFDKIEPNAQGYGLVTFRDQCRAVWSFKTKQPNNPELVEIIISTEDELLDNNSVIKNFQGYKIIVIETKHADLIGSQDEYLNAIATFDEYSESR